MCTRRLATGACAADSCGVCRYPATQQISAFDGDFYDDDSIYFRRRQLQPSQITATQIGEIADDLGLANKISVAVGCYFCLPSEGCDSDHRDMHPDRCTSSFIGGQNPAFARHCYMNSLLNTTSVPRPAYCDCTGAAFGALVEGSPLCELERATLGELFVDTEPAPIFHIDAQGQGASYSYVDQLGSAQQKSDAWHDLTGWRVPLIVDVHVDSSALGELSGYSQANGALGNGSCSSAPQLTATGVIGHLPHGIVNVTTSSGQSACVVTPAYKVTTQSLEELSADILANQLFIRDGVALPAPEEPFAVGAISRELEQLFPSAAIEVHDLNLSAHAPGMHPEPPGPARHCSSALQLGTAARHCSSLSFGLRSAPCPHRALPSVLPCDPPMVYPRAPAPHRVLRRILALGCSAALRSSIALTSFWGSPLDWPLVRAPDAWPVRAEGEEFRIAKLNGGDSGRRWSESGGIGAILQSWWVNAMMRVGVHSNASVSASFKPFPYERTADELLRRRGVDVNLGDPTVLALLVDAALPLATSFTLPLVVSTVVIEKEHKLRALMVMMGLRMRWYWLCEWLWSSLITSTINLALLIAGAVGGLEFVRRSVDVFLLLLMLWAQCTVATGCLISTVQSRLLTSTVATYLLVIALILLSIVLNQVAFAGAGESYPTVLLLIAPMAYYRAIHLLYGGAHTFGALGGEMRAIFWMLSFDTVLYAVLAAYLDAVMPREFGVTRPPLFFLHPVRDALRRRGWLRADAPSRPWMRAAKTRVSSTGESTTAPSRTAPEPAHAEEDVDVSHERRLVEDAVERRRAARAAQHDAGLIGARVPERLEPAPIEMVSLRKVYAGGKVAVRDLTLSIHENECFGLLGPNGAGKTSTIAMLTGLYPPSGGAITICGFDAATQMHRIHEAMGVCPQFDILWPLLTVLEHLRFYLRLKGCPADEVADRASASAVSVELDHAANRRVSRISGGMKRRVSLAISLLAEPSVIFLDEPTTGLDPETKRSMWSLIDIAKKGRSIVLTTHSMEEADALCGRIGIMAYGVLRCLGPSLHLKRRFGDGFRVEVTHLEDGVEAALAFLNMLLPGGVPASQAVSQEGSSTSGANTIVLQLPHNSVRLSELFASMEARPEDARIVHWSLSQPSLEEVFLKLSRVAETEQRGVFSGSVTDLPPPPPTHSPPTPPTPLVEARGRAVGTTASCGASVYNA